MSTRLTLLAAAILLAALGPAPAIAGGTFIDPCGNKDVYTGQVSKLFICAIGANGSSSSAGTGVAGQDFFENHISPVHLSGFLPGDVANGLVYEDDTNPTWDVPKTFTLLELDGRVKVDAHDPNASITLTLIGILGGCVNAAGCVGGDQQLGPFTFGPGTSTDIAVASIVEQFTAPVATELLIIDVSGNATYNVDGSPLFEAVPEPGTLSLFGGGTILLVASKLRMRLRRKTA